MRRFTYLDEILLNKSPNRVPKHQCWSTATFVMIQLPGESTKCLGGILY